MNGKYITCERILCGTCNLDKFDPINRLILISEIPLSGPIVVLHATKLVVSDLLGIKIVNPFG
jgi:hypothetical protein